MAYTVPTASDLQARFPAFADTPTAAIEGALDEAAAMVGDEWITQGDFTLGRLLYAAHVLTLDGHGTGAEAEVYASGAGGFSRIKTGDATLDRHTPEEGWGVLAATTFGQRFIDVARRNSGGPVALDVPTLPKPGTRAGGYFDRRS